MVDVQNGSTIDLSVANNQALTTLTPSGASSVTVFRSPNVGVYFPSGTPGDDQIAFNR